MGVSVRREHVVDRYLQVERPFSDDLALDEARPVLSRILGDATVRQKTGEKVGVAHRPRTLAENVDEDRPLGRVQDLLLGGAPACRRVEDKRFVA